MTPRTRSQDLTADLLHDLQAEEAAPQASAASPGSDEPVPFVVTSLYLTPRGWRRPAVSLAGGSVSVSAGPVRLRIGHDPS